MNRPRILRLPRIAFSVVCVIVCLLLVALWVRSYHWAEVLYFPLSDTRTLTVSSGQGGVSMSPYVPTVSGYFDSWKLQTETIDQRENLWADHPSWTIRNLRLGFVRHSTYVI